MIQTPGIEKSLELDVPYLVDAVREWTETHARPGMQVYDRAGVALGTVVHVHEGPLRAGSADLESRLEMRTGPFGLGPHLYIPFAAIEDIAGDSVFLADVSWRLPLDEWQTRPAALDAPPPPPDTEPPPLDADRWEQARGAYWRHWASRYGTEGLEWAPFEPRYRFVWMMGRHSPYATRPWEEIQGELHTAWDALHPRDEWEQAAEMIRDAWELRRAALIDWLAA